MTTALAVALSAFLVNVTFSGCGSAEPESADSTGAALETASINAPSADTFDGSPRDGGSLKVTAEAVASTADSAVATLQQIRELRTQPLPEDLEKARTTRRGRNEQIIAMATDVVRETMDDPDRSELFLQAIAQLLESRFQLAMSGDRSDIDIMYSDVESLVQRDPKSPAAAEGMYKLARLAHTFARMYGRQQPDWLLELSRLSRDFADQYPEQPTRAIPLLFGAAQSCELHAAAIENPAEKSRMLNEARLCYAALAQKWSNTPRGSEAVAVLRRMNVVGKPLTQFGGPTLDGGYASVEDLNGSAIVIVFWSSDNRNFAEQWIPELSSVANSPAGNAIRILGVCMDEDESALDVFLETHSVPGKHIFFGKPDQRAWDNPLARFWGVSRLPSVWIVDRSGNVVDTAVTPASLKPTLSGVLNAGG